MEHRRTRTDRHDEDGSLVAEYGLIAVLGATITGVAISWAGCWIRPDPGMNSWNDVVLGMGSAIGLRRSTEEFRGHLRPHSIDDVFG